MDPADNAPEQAEHQTEATPAETKKQPSPSDAALGAERKARRDAEKALSEARSQLAALADKDKSELQRATERAEAAEKAANEATTRWQAAAKTTAIITAATAANAIDADAVAALIGSQITVTDTGDVEGVDTALTQLQANKPHLFSTTPPPPQGMRDAAARGANLQSSKTMDDWLRGK